MITKMKPILKKKHFLKAIQPEQYSNYKYKQGTGFTDLIIFPEDNNGKNESDE